MTTLNMEAESRLLDRVRKLLAKAEDEACTPPEAEALTAKAAELMAKYGIDRARLAASQPDTDRPASRMFDLDNPWARVKAHLLCGLARAFRGQAIMLPTRPGSGSVRIHVFAYQSDLERLDLLYTSVLLQMAHGLALQFVPGSGGRAKAWRRSWMLGFSSAVIARVRQAEQAAAAESEREPRETGSVSTAVVLADRSLAIQQEAKRAYPTTRTARVTYSGSGYRDGHAAGQRANLGGTGVGRRTAGALR